MVSIWLKILWYYDLIILINFNNFIIIIHTSIVWLYFYSRNGWTYITKGRALKKKTKKTKGARVMV